METEAQTTPSSPPAPDSLLAAREAPQALHRAVNELPDNLAQLFELRASGLSYEEIAEILSVPLGTVKSRMHDMVARLKSEMKPWTAQ